MVLTMGELARALDAQCWGDQSIRVTVRRNRGGRSGRRGWRHAGHGHSAPKYAEALKPGSIAILAEGMDPEAYGLKAAIFAPRPRLVMAGLTRAFDRGPDIAPGIHPTAVIDPTAMIGDGAAIAPFVVIGAHVRIGQGARIGSHVSIGRGARIGDQALIHPGVRIGHDVTAGDRLIVQPGASIGGDGFSFVTPVGDRGDPPHPGCSCRGQPAALDAHPFAWRGQAGS